VFLTKSLLVAVTLTAGLLTSPPAAARPHRIPEPPHRLPGALAVVAGSAQARAAAPYPKTRAALDDLVKAGASGAVVLIRKGGSTTMLAAGVADRRTDRPMQLGDRFRVGSITKSFVATVVLQLVGEQRLSLSDTVARFLPGLLPQGKVITVKELLQHTSGLYDYSMDPRVAAPYLRGNLGYRWTPRRLVAIAVKHGQLFPPGARWYYSSTNYVVLGLIIEAVTKHTLASELTRRILGPLRLHATRLGADANMGSPAAHGYYKGRDVTPVSFSWAWGAGSMVSTAADVARFYQALFGGRLLRPQQLKQMETTVTGAGGDYGLGLWEQPLLCGDAWGHLGETAGYRSLAWSSRDGRHQTVVLATTTSTPAAPEVDAALDALADAAFCAS
jgi:D-alanyl-D-alanine carboxypeptidase